jgi:SRSO17 transposase
MNVSALQSKGPSYSFQPSGLRAIAARFLSMCQVYSAHFHTTTRSVVDEARSYLSGLLMKAPRKNIERMGEYVEHCDYESTQHFISESPWGYRSLIDHVARDVDAAIGGDQSVLDIDESGFTKKGTRSVGVSRQYNGRLGKVDNCQVAVFGALTDGQKASLIDTRLYLSREWINDEKRCETAGIPESQRQFRTKPQLGLEIIDNALRNNIRFGYISFDGLYGNTPEFLSGLEQRKLMYVGAIHKDQMVYLEDPHPYMPRRKNKVGRKHTLYQVRKEGIRVDVLNENMTNRWHFVTIRRGTKGYVCVECRRKRVWIWQEGEKNAREVWLIIIRDPFSKEVKYFISNANIKTPLKTLVEKAAYRFFIERAFQDAKTSVGMADYQVRVWNGWHHHMAMVMLAMLFLLKERILNSESVTLLSCQDIIELLNLYLPRADLSEEAIFRQMEERHKKRQASIQKEYEKQEIQCAEKGFNLTM